MICSSHPYLSCCLKRVAVTADADSLLSRAKSEPVKAACKKVFEALRYSDPVSAYGLVDVEERIKAEFDVLTDAVIADDPKAFTCPVCGGKTEYQDRDRVCGL